MITMLLSAFIQSSYFAGDHSICQNISEDDALLPASMGYLTGWMPYLSSKQQCQSTEEILITTLTGNI